jgi:hypothetical protein
VGLLSAGELGQAPLTVSLLSNQRGRIFGGYYTLADKGGASLSKARSGKFISG